ncbi:hypothetical protein PPYR_00384 [Photinus pyralis]|uniref:Guanylate cyclase domain-containing protein n=2 Tax=Photinus pyralis TaxID=7054 RepID=A0A5N4B1F9_PHOPY|nr:adenylate cyclase type 10-like [Photinus pyralis]KAB0803414.1 hypothetical protein PPYR_00384 [Photinus pyralis]
MMEGMHQNVDEEFILTLMKINSNRRDDSDLWKNRRPQPLKSGVIYPIKKRKAANKVLLPMTDNHTSKVLATLIPDEIIYNVSDLSKRRYDACLLFGDISGFTDLCEMYNKTGKGGPSKLTQVLNNYIGSMVQEILTHNGDVLKFSGDAFISMWKVTSSTDMRSAVHAAVDSAIMIQKTLGAYETDVGVFLRVKLAISAGPVIFSIIGTKDMSHYVCAGQPIEDVKKGEKKAHPGEIIVTSLAWSYLNPNEFLYENYTKHYVKVKNITTLWIPVHQSHGGIKKMDLNEDEESHEDLIKTYGEDSEGELVTNSKTKQNDEFSIRPSVDYAADMNSKQDLRKFIITPIMRGIDLDEPLEYLTEMRQIVIVFINVTVDPHMDTETYIDLSDASYRRVCKLAENKQGCVNKMSLFDKDLMFVLLFGLRGYKNEMESQMGLRCGLECHQSISQLDITSVSVAVTTGMTYCGVVGHTLRREYTAISLTVNKAARLMMAYPGIVTCDRETFLHSKLEAKKFVLQEPIPLKGITNVGPIYEFREQCEIEEKITISLLPILDRTEEVNIFRDLLYKCIDACADRGKTKPLNSLDVCNVILVQGNPRIGKTRLLEEYVHNTPSSIPINRFALSKRDVMIAYKTIQLIFLTPLGITELDSTADRETKLQLILHKVKSPEYFGALNKVFNVNFEKSAAYNSLTTEKKKEVLLKLLKHLCYLSFSTMWLIAIDNAEHIDDESWSFIATLCELDVIFTILTVNTHDQLSKVAMSVFNNTRLQVLQLKPVDKWYHAALACQFLGVEGIPPELEKVIQDKSEGNPGWIQNFVTCLLQAGGLEIQRVKKNDINELGLVTPGIELLTRYSSEDIRDIEDGQDSYDSIPFSSGKDDAWSMYKYSFRDSSAMLPTLIKKEKMEERNYISICTIVPKFNLEQVETELPMNVMVVKLFDSLTPYQQLLLKCSSVLGEYFFRAMLVYVMGSTSHRETALAIQKLYELRVLGCAHGDFTHGESNIIFSKHFSNPNTELYLKCYCKNIKVHESCLDLPKYASCGYLRFRQTTFKETTYNLLTENKKKEFHDKAISYLGMETNRCKSCGYGNFVKLLGVKRNEGFAKIQPSSTKHRTKWTNVLRIGGSSSTTSLTRNASQLLSIKKPHISDWDIAHPSNTGCFSDILQSNFCLNTGLVKQLHRSLSLTKTFSYADFSSCQCPLILSTVYTQMILHCTAAKRTGKLIEAMVEYSQICIISCNSPQAIKILEEALLILEDQEETRSNYDQEEQWKVTFIKAKIDTLFGHALLELGHLDDAYMYFKRGLSNYGFEFSENNLKRKLKTFTCELKQKLHFYVCNNMFTRQLSQQETEFNDNISQCLALMYQLFKELQMWEHAELAAALSLDRSLLSDSDFLGMCTAYTNMIDVAHHFGRECLCVALEVNSLYICHRKSSSIESQELTAVCHLYGVIFLARLVRSEIERAIHIGKITLQVCNTIHSVRSSLKVLPLMAQALLLRNRIQEAVTKIQDIEYYAQEDTDNSGKAWFYALCVTLQLETGYTLIPFRICEKFFQIEGETLVHIRDSDAGKRFYTVMWLWCVRNEEWEMATKWHLKIAMIDDDLMPDDSLNNMFTALYYMEGLLLYLVGKLNKSMPDQTTILDKIETIIHSIQCASKIMKVIEPRFKHLLAYYLFAQNRVASAFSALYKAKVLAEKNGNLIEVAWIEHSEKAWSNTLSPVLLDFWKEHCELDNLMDYHEIDLNNGQLGLFTLPVPKYY